MKIKNIDNEIVVYEEQEIEDFDGNKIKTYIERERYTEQFLLERINIFRTELERLQEQLKRLEEIQSQSK